MVFASQAANIVQLYVSDGEVVIEGTSAEMGKQEAEVAVETDGYMPDYHDQDGLGAIAVNGAYLLDALAAVGSNEEVRIDMTTPSSPLKMQPVGNGAFLHIIMPMHLGQ
jgi:DNA polymerase III sliding clamp (beta) subunit (PCNA family)